MSKKFWILILTVLVLTPTAFAQTASDGSSLPLMLGNLGNILKQNLHANTVLGTPIAAGEVTLIPVIAKGFGMGLGEGLRSQGESQNREKMTEESSLDRKGTGGGLGGFARPIAIIVVKKDGNIQIHKLQSEGWLAQGIQALIPVFQNMINKKFEIQLKRREEAGSPAASSQPSAPPQPGR